MNRKQSIIAIIAAISLVFAFTLVALPGSALGDAGGFSGGSDFGGGWDSGGSSWDSGGSSWDSSDWDDDDDDWGWSSSGSSGSGSSWTSSGGSSEMDDAFLSVCGGALCLGFILIVGFLMFRTFRGRNSGAAKPVGAMPTPENQLRSVEELKAIDPNFNRADLESNLSNLYVQMQYAWTAKDFEPMRPHFIDSYWAQFDSQLEQLRRNHQTNYVNNIAVLESTLRGWYETEENQCMVARLRTRINDFTVDDKTGNVLNGSPTADVFMTYEWTLVRTKGSMTQTQEQKTEARACPHCGAPLDLNQSTRCEYCGSIIESKDYDWVISNIKGISKETVGK